MNTTRAQLAYFPASLLAVILTVKIRPVLSLREIASPRWQ
jgi:hypothetical protein